MSRSVAVRLKTGAPGTAANLPRQPLTPGLRGLVNARTTETTNYQTSRTVTRIAASLIIRSTR